MRPLLLLAVLSSLLFASALEARKPSEKPTPRKAPLVEKGEVSYYADKFVGRKTASGERYSHKKATCAHRTHKFGTRLRVTIPKTKKAVICRVNDRGPYVKGRVVDLSRSLAEEAGLLKLGVAKARVEVVMPLKPKKLKR